MIVANNGKIVLHGSLIGSGQDCCCNVELGACCEFYCAGCTYGQYRWNGTEYAIYQCYPSDCPTTTCPDCPATVNEAYLQSIGDDTTGWYGSLEWLGLSFCCPYPDSKYYCSQTTAANCGEWKVWTPNATCPGTEEEVQQYCQGRFDEAFP